ncbi:zinc finger protein 839-like isoform X1 [Huso huso]|uniref:Zinc finger protein 839-like isoform X1 n=1 Tax=Huso huso TaxID=61971 RepID=A0ABR0Z1T6_HUSHU
MAEQEDESNLTTRVAERNSEARQQCIDQIHNIDGEVVARVTDSSTSCVEFIAKDFTAKEFTDTAAAIPEYVHVAAVAGVEGTVDGNCHVVNTYAVGDGLLTEECINITSFVETPGVETMTSVDSSDFTSVTEELVDGIGHGSTSTSTIIYVQPDGTFVEGTGLTAEEQQQLVEQLAKQQLVEVTENEAAHIFETHQHQPHFIQHSGTLAPEELQQVIEQVAKSNAQQQQHSILSLLPQDDQPVSQRSIMVSEASCISIEPSSIFTSAGQLEVMTPQPLSSIMQNASQQLQNAAKQVALQQSQANNGTRILQKKQLETIRIQVQNRQPEPTERPPLAVFQPSARVGVPAGLNLSSPQIIRIQPVMGTGQQQFLLHSSTEPPIQLLVQRQTPPLRAEPTACTLPVKNTVNGKAARPSARGAAALALTVSAGSDRKERDREKMKPQKIKTRSGRISRPPKYKVKDYKFIKRQDLADGHQSDSDDYSEISEEEEEGGEDAGKGATSIHFNLNPKAFKCETCEKAYIGRGGLSRHYRLNPPHGQKNAFPPEPVGSVSLPSEDLSAGSGVTPIEVHSTVTVTSEQATPAEVLDSKDKPTALPPAPPAAPAEAAKPAPEEPQVVSDPTPAEPPSVQTVVSCPGPGKPRGPGRPRGAGRPGRPKVSGRSGRPGRRARPGRPPKYLGGVSTEQQIQRRKARLKEIIQQCDNEELMELALPRLARVMTVWEFLLMKVEKGRPSRPHFADVYREFEQLHSQVKNMAADHFRSPLSLGSQQPLEIRDTWVSKSLGIEELLKKQKRQHPGPLLQCFVTVCKEDSLPSPRNKHAMESEYEGLMPPEKRMRLENCAGVVNGIDLTHNGLQTVVEEVNFTAITAGQGLSRTPSDPSALPQGGAGETSKSLQADPISRTVLQSGNEEPRSTQRHANMLLYQPLEGALQDSQNPLVEGESGASAAGEEQSGVFSDFTPEELVQEQLSSHSVNVEMAADELTCQVETDKDMLLSTAAKMSPQVSFVNPESSEPLKESDLADQVQLLERALCRDVVPLDHSYRTQTSEPEPPPPEQQPRTVKSTGVCLGNEIGGEAVCSLQGAGLSALDKESRDENGSVEHTVTIGGTVEFQLSDENQELLTQGHDQIFIQTSEGLILHHAGGALPSEGIVMVTDADGTTMHIRTPEGVSFETVQALLAMEAEGHSEGILLSETHL